MPAHSYSRIRSAAPLVLALLMVGACDDAGPSKGKPSKAAPSVAPKPLVPPQSTPRIGPASKPLARLAIGYIKKASSAAVELARSIDKGTPARAAYVRMRRYIASGAPLFRRRAQLGSEVLLGPPRSITEAGGALAALDVALSEGDMTRAKAQMEQVVRALRLVDNELTLNGVPSKGVGQALADQCFELGLLLLEANAAIADQPDAVLADTRGTLDAIQQGARVMASLATPPAKAGAEAALKGVLSAASPLAIALARVEHAHQLRDRATLVHQSGKLGVAIRRLAGELDLRVTPPYLARYPAADNQAGEIITPLTLPAARPDARGGDRRAMTALGKKLFNDKRLSRDSQRSCADCHQPAKGFSDGLAAPKSLDPKQPLKRNTPTLLYTSLHAAQLWDGQFASAEHQALRVIHTFAEMGLSSKELIEVVANDATYNKGFSEAFEDGVTERNVARSLVAYEVNELAPGNAPIDRFAQGDATALSESARRGLDVFSGVGRCARCHIPPLFGGSRPTDFSTPVYAVLGVPTEPESKELDEDLGRGKISSRPLDDHGFKTPTVRNVRATAPFFHHGKFNTLESVVEFYDKGGGKGLGIAIDNQDPDVRPLKLTAEQKADLLLFMRAALTDE